MADNCNSPLPNSDINCPEPSDWANCRPWSIETDAVNCYANDLVDESLQIGGVTVNVYKLLGVHEQTKLIDRIGSGNSISSQSQPLFPASNAFNTTLNEWRSYHVGHQLIDSGFIGYDFGEVPLLNRNRYGIEANVRYNISTIKIKQGKLAKNRVKRARIERSDDNKIWYGVQVVDLPDDNKLNTIHFKGSVPSRYWRIRPVEINAEECDYWSVQALELIEYEQTHLTNIQDKIWLENRTRDYDKVAIKLKGFYTPNQVGMDLTRFGIERSEQTFYIKMSFSECVASLGRPIVVGDILNLPNEAMFSPTLQRQELYLEVTSVAWDTTGTITPGWQFTMLSVTASPALASEETQDIFGDLFAEIDDTGLSNINDGNNENYQDFMDITQHIKADSNSEVHERGADDKATSRYFSEEELEVADSRDMGNIRKYNLKPKKLYVEDAMPPNGADYTEGPDFPLGPVDKAYHRLTYEGSARDIPARLHQFSAAKNRWIYLETDRRKMLNNQKNTIDEYLTATNKTPLRKIK